MSPIFVNELGHHWFRWGFSTCLTQSHYLNQCWLYVDYNTGYEIRWNFRPNKIIQEKNTWIFLLRNGRPFANKYNIYKYFHLSIYHYQWKFITYEGGVISFQVRSLQYLNSYYFQLLLEETGRNCSVEAVENKWTGHELYYVAFFINEANVIFKFIWEQRFHGITAVNPWTLMLYIFHKIQIWLWNFYSIEYVVLLYSIGVVCNLSYYRKYADVPERIELLKCLSGALCHVCV